MQYLQKCSFLFQVFMNYGHIKEKAQIGSVKWNACWDDERSQKYKKSTYFEYTEVFSKWVQKQANNSVIILINSNWFAWLSLVNFHINEYEWIFFNGYCKGCLY